MAFSSEHPIIFIFSFFVYLSLEPPVRPNLEVSVNESSETVGVDGFVLSTVKSKTFIGVGNEFEFSVDAYISHSPSVNSKVMSLVSKVMSLIKVFVIEFCHNSIGIP